ncbi:MAG: NADH-quinone oxidoreductase subunit NuoH [Actinomycetota bacterium]
MNLEAFFADPWLLLAGKILGVLGVFVAAMLVVGYGEHKVMAHMQARLGPMEAGRFHGWAQLIADGVKFLQKEDIVPAAADRTVFKLAPAVVMIPTLMVFVVIPWAPGLAAEKLDVGLFYVLAISSVSVVGVLMAAWASANKFSLIGGLRAAAQLISYELPLVFASAAVAIQAGTMSLVGIVEAQHAYPFVLTQFVGLAVFFMAGLAELSRSPFDMPMADSEIIFGSVTEYSGLRMAFFMLTEYAGIAAISAIASVLYLGGWKGPFYIPGLEKLTAVGWTVSKTLALAFVMIWARSTFPRLREDQLQRFSWQLLIPTSLGLILVVGACKVVF